YFDRSSYISAGFFAKKVKNFVGVGQIPLDLFGLRDPTSGAAGTRSGDAIAQIADAGAVLSEVSLFSFVALIDQNGGDVAAARADFEAQLTGAPGNRQLNQAFVDNLLAARDVIANAD